MKFKLLEKKLQLVINKKIVHMCWHKNLFIITTIDSIIVFKDRKKLFTLRYFECFTKKHIIYPYENFIYYRHQNYLHEKQKQSLIRKKNLFNRYQGLTSETKYHKIITIQVLKDFLYVLTQNQIIRENLLGKSQIQHSLKLPIDFIAYDDQIVILQWKELNFFNTDLIKVYTILLVEQASKVQNNMNYLFLFRKTSLVIIDLLQNKQIYKISIINYGCDDIYYFGLIVSIMPQQFYFCNEEFNEILIYSINEQKCHKMLNSIIQREDYFRQIRKYILNQYYLRDLAWFMRYQND